MDKHVPYKQFWIQMPGTRKEQGLLLQYFRSLDLSWKRKTYSVSMKSTSTQDRRTKTQGSTRLPTPCEKSIQGANPRIHLKATEIGEEKHKREHEQVCISCTFIL